MSTKCELACAGMRRSYEPLRLLGQCVQLLVSDLRVMRLFESSSLSILYPEFTDSFIAVYSRVQESLGRMLGILNSQLSWCLLIEPSREICCLK